MSKDVIEAKELVKKFGDFVAVDGISFNIKEGECFGFLGPNGAGKTTTMRMIYGLSPMTSGSLRILGYEVPKDLRLIKSRLGVAPQELSLDPDLLVMQNLMMYATYFDLSHKEALRKSEELLHFFHLYEKRKSTIDQISGGMKRRLLMARALINDPSLLILDEPTTGLDPQSRHALWDSINALKAKGVTTLLTTHYMEEAEMLCDRLLVIDYGKIIDEGSPKELIQKHGAPNLEGVFLKLTGKTLRD